MLWKCTSANWRELNPCSNNGGWFQPGVGDPVAEPMLISGTIAEHLSRLRDAAFLRPGINAGRVPVIRSQYSVAEVARLLSGRTEVWRLTLRTNPRSLRISAWPKSSWV